MSPVVPLILRVIRIGRLFIVANRARPALAASHHHGCYGLYTYVNYQLPYLMQSQCQRGIIRPPAKSPGPTRTRVRWRVRTQSRTSISPERGKNYEHAILTRA